MKTLCWKTQLGIGDPILPWFWTFFLFFILLLREWVQCWKEFGWGLSFLELLLLYSYFLPPYNFLWLYLLLARLLLDCTCFLFFKQRTTVSLKRWLVLRPWVFQSLDLSQLLWWWFQLLLVVSWILTVFLAPENLCFFQNFTMTVSRARLNLFQFYFSFVGIWLSFFQF